MERQSAEFRPVVLETVADRVLDGPAPVPFVAIRGQVRSRLGYRVGVRRLDRAVDQLVADELLAVVHEADPEAHRCRVFALGPRLLGGGAA